MLSVKVGIPQGSTKAMARHCGIEHEKRAEEWIWLSLRKCYGAEDRVKNSLFDFLRR